MSNESNQMIVDQLLKFGYTNNEITAAINNVNNPNDINEITNYITNEADNTKITLRMITNYVTHAMEQKGDEKYDEKDTMNKTQSNLNQHTNNITQINANQLRFQKTTNTEDLSGNTPIGQGKFGAVYKAVYDNETVAVKQYKRETDYFQEIGIIKHINLAFAENKYRNILKPIGICGQLLVIEYMRKGSADKLLYSASNNNIRKQLYILDILDILIDVCNGMQCLHSMGIIHRDLSARNLLFEANDTYSNNTKYTVKICDFGECVINKNKTDSRKGPYLWLAPECIREQICNVKTDIYSFGILCYELIVGARPFPIHKTSVEQAIIEVLVLSYRPNITSYRKLLPFQLFILVQICWQQIAEYRQNNFGDILTELRVLRDYISNNKSEIGCVNTRLDKICFDANKSKEILKDLGSLIEYLSDENNGNMTEENEFTKKTKHELLKKIFNYNYKLNQDRDTEAINFYVRNFPWGEQKDEEKRRKAVQNVNKYTQKYTQNSFITAK